MPVGEASTHCRREVQRATVTLGRLVGHGPDSLGRGDMKTSLAIALALPSLLLAGLSQVGATAFLDDPLPCRTNSSIGLVRKVNNHAAGRKRICQVGRDTAVATITKQVQDDSIRAIRHVLTLQKRRGAWRVVTDLHIQRCQGGRGHQAFSRTPCV
jgi:hypothetical protein